MRVLVVEDDLLIAQSLKTGLINEQFAVDVVDNGQDAYQHALSDHYDLVILDRMLPILDGVEVCKKLRINKIRTPILMLTAKDTIDDRVEGLDSGADDYLVKPFAFDELLARMRALLRRNTTLETILRVEELELDPASHLVKRHGKEVHLTGKEYALLEYLMRHPQQILSKQQILDHVWDYSYQSYSNIVEVMIRRLRNKIDKSFPKSEPLFSTVRGLGYRIGN